MVKDPEPSDRKAPKPFNSFLKYSGLAFQLVATIGVAGWLGYRLDIYLAFNFPIFLVTFTLASFAGVMIHLYRSINQS